MHESLLKYISNHSTTPMTEDEIEVIRTVFIPKKIRKHQYFLQAGEVCKYAAFLVKGSMRQYTVDDKGGEHINRLFIENWWVGDRESHIMLTPSKYNIDAWEDCDLLLLTRTDYMNHLIQIPAINEMMRIIDDNFAITVQKRITSLTLPAEERYTELMKINPEFIQRFPQHIIAAYLGIAKETLSRVRNHGVKTKPAR